MFLGRGRWHTSTLYGKDLPEQAIKAIRMATRQRGRPPAARRGVAAGPLPLRANSCPSLSSLDAGKGGGASRPWWLALVATVAVLSSSTAPSRPAVCCTLPWRWYWCPGVRCSGASGHRGALVDVFCRGASMARGAAAASRRGRQRRGWDAEDRLGSIRQDDLLLYLVSLPSCRDTAKKMSSSLIQWREGNSSRLWISIEAATTYQSFPHATTLKAWKITKEHLGVLVVSFMVLFTQLFFLRVRTSLLFRLRTARSSLENPKESCASLYIEEGKRGRPQVQPTQHNTTAQITAWCTHEKMKYLLL